MANDFRSARFWASAIIEKALFEGATAVDATLGNGHDCLWLCGLVGESGRVYGFDIQKEAVERSRIRLRENGVESRATLIHDGHQNLLAHVEKETADAVMFNLGWLPGAEHAVTTLTRTTLEAAQAACELIAPGGIVTICVYPGHDEGKRELDALDVWAESLSVRTYNILRHHFVNAPLYTPQLFLIQKNG